MDENVKDQAPGDPEPSVEVVAEEYAEMSDPITRRESFELELMEEGRSDQGAEVELEDEEGLPPAPGDPTDFDPASE